MKTNKLYDFSKHQWLLQKQTESNWKEDVPRFVCFIFGASTEWPRSSLKIYKWEEIYVTFLIPKYLVATQLSSLYIRLCWLVSFLSLVSALWFFYVLDKNEKDEQLWRAANLDDVRLTWSFLCKKAVQLFSKDKTNFSLAFY